MAPSVSATSLQDLLNEHSGMIKRPSKSFSSDDFKRKAELDKLSRLVEQRNKTKNAKNKIALGKLIEESRKLLQPQKSGNTPPENVKGATGPNTGVPQYPQPFRSWPGGYPPGTPPPWAALLPKSNSAAPSTTAPATTSTTAPSTTSTRPAIQEVLPTGWAVAGRAVVSGPESESMGTANVDYWRGKFGLSMIGQFPEEDEFGYSTGLMDPKAENYRIGAYARGVSPETLAGSRGSYFDNPMGAQIDPRMSDRNLGYSAGMSIPEAEAFYWSLNDLELIKFQNDLFEAGFMPQKPTLGLRDSATDTAFGNFLRTSMVNPDKPIDLLLKEGKSRNLGLLREKINAKLYGKSGLGSASSTVTNVNVTDKQTLGSMLDVVGRELFGEYLDPAVKAQLIDKLRTQEFQYGVEQNKLEMQAAGDSSSKDLNSFMEAMISQESGGDPNAVNPDTGAFGLGQFMYWSDWAREAGAEPRDISPDNQRRVMKFKLAQYYETYGNWRDVAVAWYAGPGNVAMAKTGGGNRKETYGPSIQSYADDLLYKMNSYMNEPIGTGGSTGTYGTSESLPSADIRAKEELKRLDPDRYLGTQFAKQADAFFGLLNGVR